MALLSFISATCVRSSQVGGCHVSTCNSIPAAFFDQIFPWSFWSIDQLDRLFHICLEFCHVVPVVLRCVAISCVLCRPVVLHCVALRCVAICCMLCGPVVLCCVALCCCHALYLFCFDVVFSSLS